MVVREIIQYACVSLVLVCCCAAATAQPIALKISKTKPTTIDANSNYAETNRFTVLAVYGPGSPLAGEIVDTLNVQVRVEEWRTKIYDGLYGATELPLQVTMQNGRAEFQLRSLARYKVIEQRSAPVPEIAVYLGDQYQRIVVPQWVDDNNDGDIDWLHQRVKDMVHRGLNSNVEIVRQVLAAVTGWQQSWRRDCGGVLPESPTVVQIGAACLNTKGESTHRTNMDKELAATILHEARHVWVYRHADQVDLPRVYSPSRNGSINCRQNELQDCVPDSELNIEAVQAHENDAEAFAQQYKGYLQ